MNAGHVLRGLAASPGWGHGRARVVRTVAELASVESGDILIAPYALPDLVAAFDRIGGFVTDQGGRLAHAAVIARELQLPAVVGAQTATASVPDGSIVVVDGTAGTVEVLWTTGSRGGPRQASGRDGD
jgi:pyruvate,water dikinase